MGSLDIYTAEYALKIGGGEKKGITAMEQKTAFHMKVGTVILYMKVENRIGQWHALKLFLQVENESESEMELCGRCHLPTHK